MDIFLTISYLLGCAICCIMAVKDFKRNIPAYQNNKIRILLYTVLFMVVVLVVYIGLLDVLVGISLVETEGRKDDHRPQEAAKQRMV